MKKIALISLLIIAILAMSSMVFAATSFSDVKNTKYETAVTKLASSKIVNGFEDGTFRPGENVTRAQMAKLLVEALSLKNVTGVALTQFPDVTSSNWFYSYVKTAVDNKIIVGYPDGTFKPNDNVTFAECMAMIIRAMKLEDSMTDKTWPTAYMTKATQLGLLSNVTYADVNSPASRGEISISLYNMVTKIENDNKQAEMDKIEQDQKAVEEAKKNAYTFGVCTDTSITSSYYYAIVQGIKSKQEIYSIKGSKSLTDSKVEALEDTVIAYKDSDDGLKIDVYYTHSSLDKAKIITSVSNDIVTFKDGDKWDTTTKAIKDKFLTYSFVRVTVSIDDDSEYGFTFSKTSSLGIGITKADFNKTERVLVDDTNKIVLIVKGFSNTDTIKNGYLNSDDSDTSGYKYGYVTKTGTRSKVDYAKIDKIEYDVASSSSDFEEDTYVVFTETNDEIKLVKSFGTSDLDERADIVSSVSGKRGEQTIKYKGSSSSVDYYTKSNTSKYKSYKVVIMEISPASKNSLTVDNHYTEDSLEDVLFSVGDRVIIDSKTKVFIIFTGLEYDSSVKKGKYYSPDETEEEENKYYTMSYGWATGKSISGVALPSSEKAKVNTKYTVKFPSDNRYTYTSNKGTSFTVTGDTKILITPKAKASYKVTYVLASGTTSNMVTLPSPNPETVYAGNSYTIKTPTAKTGYKVTSVSPSGTKTISGNITVTVACEAKKTYKVKYVVTGDSASKITKPADETVYEGDSYTIKTISPISGYTITVSPNGTKTITSDLTVTITCNKNAPSPDVAARIKELKEVEIPNLTTAYNSAKSESDAAKSTLDAKTKALDNAITNYNNQVKAKESADKALANIENEIKDLKIARSDAQDAYDAAKEAWENASEEEKAAKKAAMDAAKDDLDAAKSALSDAESEKELLEANASAQAKSLQNAETAKNQAQSEKNTAESNYNSKLGITNSTKKALDDAKAELAELEG